MEISRRDVLIYQLTMSLVDQSLVETNLPSRCFDKQGYFLSIQTFCGNYQMEFILILMKQLVLSVL